MALVYGSGFKPMEAGRVRESKSAGETALFTALRVLSAVAFIALSFIPIVGEVGEATLAVGEAALETATGLTSEVVAEAALETSTSTIETTLGIANKVSSTARQLRLGDTIKGSVGLGITEALANEAIDRIEGTSGIVNSVINFGLAFVPVLGNLKASRTAKVRLLQTLDKQIAYEYTLLKMASTAEERSNIELRIRQLKNVKLVKRADMYGVALDSSTVSAANKEAMRIIDQNIASGEKIYARPLMREIRSNLETNSIKISKAETRLIVKNLAKTMPNISEGITVKGIVESKMFNRTTEAMRYLDPNLATRKFWTAAARKLTSDEAVFKFETKTGMKEYGKWLKKINLGYYKKFGQKLSKWWRQWGKKIYKHSRYRMIPVTSKWIEGYRLIPAGVVGEYIMIVIFKPSKGGRIPPPVVVNPVTLEYALKFASGEGYGGSVGSFYINRIALARNGSGASISGSLATILGPLSLGTMRKALSGPAALERLIRRFAKGDYFETWLDNVIETSGRLAPHKIGKVVAGRWGIAIARGFQKTSKGHTTIFDGGFNWNHIIEEMGIVTLDKARAVQRKAGIKGRTSIIGARRTMNQWQRTIKLGTFGYYKFDGSKGIKKGKGIF